jgi:hypothetical protein
MAQAFGAVVGEADGARSIRALDPPEFEDRAAIAAPSAPARCGRRVSERVRALRSLSSRAQPGGSQPTAGPDDHKKKGAHGRNLVSPVIAKPPGGGFALAGL